MDCRKSISVPLVKSTRPCPIFGKVVENLWNWCHGKYTLCRLLDSKNQPPPSHSRLASIPRNPRCWHHPQSVTMDNWAEHQPYKLPQCNIGIVVEIFEKCTIPKIWIVRPTISILLSLPQEFPQLSNDIIMTVTICLIQTSLILPFFASEQHLMSWFSTRRVQQPTSKVRKKVDSLVISDQVFDQNDNPKEWELSPLEAAAGQITENGIWLPELTAPLMKQCEHNHDDPLNKWACATYIDHLMSQILVFFLPQNRSQYSKHQTHFLFQLPQKKIKNYLQ